MGKKLQVFISSTHDDLVKERQTAIVAILDAGHIPAGMELFKSGKSKWETICNWIDESDVFLLILGGCYGSVEEGAELSYTEREYQYAMSKNKPMFEIVLQDRYLHMKAADEKSKHIQIFEQSNKEKYDKFKNRILKKKICQYVSNLESIKTAIHSQLNDMVNNPEYKIVGWQRADSLDIDINRKSEEQIAGLNMEIFYELLNRKYPIKSDDFINSFFKMQESLLKYEGLLNSYNRTTNLTLLNENELQVETITRLDYEYLSEKHRYFGKRFFATEQQAISFQLKKLQINTVDYTNDFEFEIFTKKYRGQFMYEVKSKKSIPIEDFPANIFYVTTYICHPLEFIQKAEPPFPCRSFQTQVNLFNDREEMYVLIGMVFSQNSKDHDDDFSSSKMKNMKTYYTMELPEWSLPGSGYMAFLKKRL